MNAHSTSKEKEEAGVFDDLIRISFEDGEYMINCLKEAHIEYVPVDLELPIIKDIFGYKLAKRRVKSR